MELVVGWDKFALGLFVMPYVLPLVMFAANLPRPRRE